ncbi:hypothetical protein F0365_12070 [Nonlabens sp. Ci31]|jgi:hypothetical protein|uniref:hypothetical protein n=1 Tax=Nonlabens sp. Ci31 TaxID=2608253 RepID=UPI0014649AF8|nr:hypothetical protein [Nonlabens sp. Ci31]QJP35073.1 hypothetical protein F0365_12070 [Nonlabens sp. Ci31]
MKTITRKFRLPLGLLFSSVFLISCLETKENEVAEVTIEQPAVEAASQKYADIVQESLNVMQDFNFDGLGTYFANDVQWYWPNGGMETRSIIKGKENVINFWKNWRETSGVESMQFYNSDFMPLKTNKSTDQYNVVGVVVLYYGDVTIYGKAGSTIVRQHIVFSFNDDDKIQKVFSYYDRTGIVQLLNVDLSSSN